MAGKDPFITEKIILTKGTNGGIEMSDGTVVVDGDGNIDAPTTTSSLTVSGTSTLTGKVTFWLNGWAASASGIFAGVWTTANPATTASAGNWMEFRTQSTATSGDARGMYWRHEIAGAWWSGESLRSFTKVSAAADTCRGAHISLDVNTTGSISGLGCGVDAQLLVPDQAIGGGTYWVVNSEIYSAGSSSSVTGSTTAFFRAVAGGDATGAATIDTSGYLMSIQWLSVGSGKLFQANTAAAATHALRILIDSTPYYIMLTDTGA